MEDDDSLEREFVDARRSRERERRQLQVQTPDQREDVALGLPVSPNVEQRGLTTDDLEALEAYRASRQASAQEGAARARRREEQIQARAAAEEIIAEAKQKLAALNRSIEADQEAVELEMLKTLRQDETPDKASKASVDDNQADPVARAGKTGDVAPRVEFADGPLLRH